MSYTIIVDEGLVLRDSDQQIIYPCQNVEDEDCVEYTNWVKNGNQPIIYDTRPI